MISRRNKNSAATVLLVWAVVLFVLAGAAVGMLVPQHHLPRFIFGHDLVCHLAAFGVLNLLVLVAISVTMFGGRRLSTRAIVLVGMAVLAASYLGEVMQISVGRRFSWFDMTANFWGVLATAILFFAWQRFRVRLETPAVADR